MAETTDEQIKDWEQRIEAMDHEEMCRLWRFADTGCPAFFPPLWERFKHRYDAFGGMTVEMSKRIGWTA